MSPAEALMWRAEGDLRTRSSGALVELLDTAPDWDRFLAAHDRAVQAIPRLRDRVVEPLLPVVEPTWTEDTHFDLSYHVQRIRLPEPGTLRQLLDLAGQLTSRPLDPNRPQWESILVEGLEGGRAGYLLKVHHAMSDGLGMVQLLSMAHSETAAPGGNRLPTACWRASRTGPGSWWARPAERSGCSGARCGTRRAPRSGRWTTASRCAGCSPRRRPSGPRCCAAADSATGSPCTTCRWTS